MVISQFPSGSPTGLQGSLLGFAVSGTVSRLAVGPGSSESDEGRRERISNVAGVPFLAHLLQASLILGDVSQHSGQGSLPACGTSLKV